MNKPLWFSIRLVDCSGQELASWSYDETYPVIPPYFTYPNEDDRCPYSLRFYRLMLTEKPLPANIDLNHAIYAATREYVRGIKR